MSAEAGTRNKIFDGHTSNSTISAFNHKKNGKTILQKAEKKQERSGITGVPSLQVIIYESCSFLSNFVIFDTPKRRYRIHEGGHMCSL